MRIDIPGLEETIRQQNAELPFSGVIQVRHQGETVLAQAFGMANRADSIPNTTGTRFAVASGSKIFTAVAVCQLVDRGMLSFDTLLKDCLNVSFPQFDPSITIHHLLTHSSGIPDYFDEEMETDFEALWHKHPVYLMRTPKDFLPLFQHLPMKFPAGERFAYSNSSFIVLGLIVEQLTGLGFQEYIRKNIFYSSDMTQSGYFATEQLPDNTALGYIEDKSTGTVKTNIFAVPAVGQPDGGAFVTVDDLAKFWDALSAGRLLDKETTHRMLQPYVEAKNEGENLAYGYGVWMRTKDSEVVSHYIVGSDPGVAMTSEIFEEENTEVTVIGNLNRPTFPMYRSVLKALGLR